MICHYRQSRLVSEYSSSRESNLSVKNVSAFIPPFFMQPCGEHTLLSQYFALVIPLNCTFSDRTDRNKVGVKESQVVLQLTVVSNKLLITMG
jgi:hypothetical protein